MKKGSKFVVWILFFLIVGSCFSGLFVPQVGAGQPTPYSITYSAVTNTITCVGANVTHPYDFWDLWNASYVNGWNKVNAHFNSSVVPSNSTPSQYLFDCKIVVGDGSTATYFTDTNKQITFTSGILTAASQFIIQVLTNATFTVGTAVDETAKTTKNGCAFINLETNVSYYCYFISTGSSNGTICLYDSVFNSPMVSGFIWANRIWNCMFKGYMQANNAYNKAWGDFDSFISTVGFRRPNQYTTTNNIILKPSLSTYTNVIWLQTYAAYLKNVYVPVISNYTEYLRIDAIGANNAYLVNVAWGSMVCYWATPTDTGRVFRQYEFDLNVLNGNITDFVSGANVTLFKGSVNVGSWLTNSSGGVPTQVLTYCYYDQAHGNTAQGIEYFTLTITHPDWENYTSKFYVTEKMRLSVSMQYPNFDSEDDLATIAIIAALFAGAVCFSLFFIRRKRSL